MKQEDCSQTARGRGKFRHHPWYNRVRVWVQQSSHYQELLFDSHHPTFPSSPPSEPLCEHRHVVPNCEQLKSSPAPDAELKWGWAGLTTNNNNRTTKKPPSSIGENADCMEKGIGGEGWGQPSPSLGPGASHKFLQRQ